MSKGTCKECRHWEKVTTQWNKTYTQCGAVEWWDRTGKIGPTDFALFVEVADDTGLMVGLKTGPDFGCSRFTAKQTRGPSG